MPTDQPDASNFITTGAFDAEAWALAFSDINADRDDASLSAFAADQPDGRTTWADAPLATEQPMSQPATKLTVDQRFGQAILRLRLYRGWTQRDLQRTCGVHQSQISRLEAGRSAGISSRRVFAILRALHADEIEFRPAKPALPPTAVEPMLWGDAWERAGRAAESRRVSRRRSA